MKRSLLYIGFFLLPLFALAQSLPAYTLTGENTVCGGNIKVDWSAAVTAGIPVSLWHVELYNSAGVKQSQKDFDAAGKAQFAFPTGTYKVKVIRKDGSKTHPTQGTQTITSTYRNFIVVEPYEQADAERAVGECTSDGKMTFKIKNGAGPFVIKLYEVGQATPAATSAPTTKSGIETTVQITTGLKANTKYEIEVTDQVGGGTCAKTETRNVRSFTTKPASASFLRSIALESCKQKGVLRGSRGMITVEINNPNAVGPFQVEVRRKDNNEVVVSASNADASFPKGGATGTTQKEIEPDAGKRLEVGKDYVIKVKDVGGNCVAERTQTNPLRFSAEAVRLHLAHTCADCGEYEFAVAAKFPNRNSNPNQVTRDKFYTYNLKVEVKRGGVMLPGFPEQFTNTDALPQTGTNNGYIYGNNEFRLSTLYDAMVHKSAYKVKAGDVITVTYEDCALATPIVLTHTVKTTPHIPFTSAIRIRKKPGGGDCDKEVEITTTFQHGSAPSYTDFCNFTGMKARVKTSNVWQSPVNVSEQFYKFYDEYDLNRHRMYVPVSGISNKYQVEYADASTALNASAPNNCKHYVSPEQTLTTTDLIDNLPVNVLYNGETILQWQQVGKRIQISWTKDIITATNPLKVTIRRKDGFQGIKTYTATGPWNLAGTYDIIFPIEKIFTADIIPNDGNLLIQDVPVGEYIMTLKNNCSTRNIPLKVEEAAPLYYDIDAPLEIVTECSKNGQAGKGKVTFKGVINKGNMAQLGYLHVFRDPGGTEPIYKRATLGNYLKQKVIDRTTNTSDPTKWDLKGEIGDLPAGDYILGINVGNTWYHTVVYKPHEKGYTYSYRPGFQQRGRLGDTFIYKPFTVKEVTDVVPLSAVGMCDPTNPNTGMIRVEMPAGAEPKYPITYTLYKVSGGTKTVVTQGGNEVKKVVTVKPNNMADANAIFNNIPKLTGGDTYEVKFESGCFDRWVPIPDFGSLTAPQVRTQAASVCYGVPTILSVDISESLYDIQWKADPASALDGIAAADLKHPSLTIAPKEEAEYWVTYKMKTGLGCGTPVEKNADRKRLPLLGKNFTDAAIGSMVDLTTTLPLNKCTGTVTWTAPAITDTEGCGYRLTWRVVKADGTELYVPTPDADGNTPALTWDGFPVGESYVEYTVKGKADGGTEGKKRFKVTVTASNIDVAVTGKFVGAVGSDTQITTIAKGHTIYYKATIENKTTQALGGGVLKVTLPDNTNGNYELPAATDSGIIRSELGSGITVSYESPRVLQFEGIDGTLFSQGTKVSVYIPIKIKNNVDCTAYENACAAILTGKPAFVFTLKNCSAAGEMTKEGDGVYAQIKNDGDCTRVELFCTGSLNLTARGTGYTSYKWYSSSDDGASYSEISGATAATRAVTAAGYYKVDKIAQCDGVESTTTEYIRVIESTDTSVDVIKEQADNIGGTCTYLDNNVTKERWVSHFLFCGGSGSKVLRANAYQGGVAWQKANGCNNDTWGNCFDVRDTCWQTISTDNTYTISGSTVGKYRLKVGSGSCFKYYYFEVSTTGFTGVLEGTPTPHSALSLGVVNLMMNVDGIDYTYTVERLSDHQILANNVDAPVDSRGKRYVKVGGLQVKSGNTSDSFKITVKAKTGFTGCKFEGTYTIPKTGEMTATVEYTQEWSEDTCSQAKFLFTVSGGQKNYRYLIYKINGAYVKPSYSNGFENIPDSEFSSFVTQYETSPAPPPDRFYQWITILQEGKYEFLIRDQDDRFAVTNEVEIGQTAKYAVSVTATDIDCAYQSSGSIVAKFLNAVVPGQKIELYKYNTNGSLQGPIQPSQLGEFNSLSAGKYKVKMSYLLSGVGQTRCVIERDVEVTSPAPIEASIGVISDNTCAANNGAFLLHVNWVTGGSGGYTFMSPSGIGSSASFSAATTLKVDGGSEANPKIQVVVRDSKNCEATFEIMAKKALVKPALAASEVTYDCGGNGSFTITPTTPAGKTYTYEYSLDGGVRQAPNGANNQMQYTGLPGRVAPYKVQVYYKEPSTTSINELYKVTFGDLERLDDSDGAPATIGSAKATGALTVGTHVVTRQLPSSTEYRSETGTGRYYAVRTSTLDNTIYDKVIENVLRSRSVSVKLRYINLGKSGLAQGVGLKVVLQYKDTNDNTDREIEKELPPLSQSDGWSEGEVVFRELEGVAHDNKVRLWIRTTVGTAAVGLDDIQVSQPTQSCQEGELRSVQVVPGKAFSATITQVEPPKCHGGDGKIYVKLFNPEPSTTYSYALSSSGTFVSTPLVGTDKLEIVAPIGTHTLKIRMIHPDNTFCEINANGTAVIDDVPELKIDNIEVLPMGCQGSPYEKAGAIVKVLNGRAPYVIEVRKTGMPSFTPATVEWTGNTGEVKDLDDNTTYEFKVKDSHFCESAVERKAIPAKKEVSATINFTKCLSVGGTGSIIVEVQDGNGGYEFSKDGGTTWVSDPGNPTQYEFDNLAPNTTYKIQVRDRLNCKTDIEDVNISEALEVGRTTDGAYGCDTPQEEVTITVRGGAKISGSYNMQWKRGGQASDITGYNPMSDNDGGNVVITEAAGTTVTYKATIKTEGMYHFLITDANGCKQTVSQEIRKEDPVLLSTPGLTGSTIACAGATDGVIGVFNGSVYLPMEEAIDRTKGVAPYTITLYESNSSRAKLGPVAADKQNGRGLSAGFYYVELKDAKGCTTHKVVEVKEKPAPTATMDEVKNATCSSGPLALGHLKISFNNPNLRDDYYIAVYTDDLYTSLATAYNLSNQETPARADFSAATSGTETIRLKEGTYYPAIVNKTTGCMVKMPAQEIGGTNVKVKEVSRQSNGCDEDEITLDFWEQDGTNPPGTIDPTQLHVAVYNSAQPNNALQQYIDPPYTAAQILEPLTTDNPDTYRKVRLKIKVLRNVPYRLMIRYNSCTTLTKPAVDTPPLTPSTTITANRLPNKCGAGASVALDYEVSGVSAPVNWAVYPYPFDTRIGHVPPSPLDSGTSGAVFAGKTSIQSTTTALAEGKNYVLVIRDASNCILNTKEFMVNQSATPLHLDEAEPISNYSCDENPNNSARVRIKVSEGVPPYRYTISTLATEPSAQQWAEPQVFTSNSREIILDKTFEGTTKKITSGTTTGDPWYVYVRDANDCTVSQQVTIKKDETPHILSAEVENMCVEGTEFTVLVIMDKVGPGQHYYTFKPTGRPETAKQPLSLIQVGANKWQGRIYRVYGNDVNRDIRIYDQNGCASDPYTFQFAGKLTFNVEQKTPLTCKAGAAGNGEIEVKDITNYIPATNHNYTYRLLREVSGGDVVVVNDASLAKTTTNFTLPITEAGKYRVEIVDDQYGNCPFSRTITIREKVQPVVLVQSYADATCFHGDTPALAQVKGGGVATLLASPGSELPMTFSIKSARYADDDSAVNFATIPSDYQNVTPSTSNDKVTVDPTGRKAIFKGLYGHTRGIIYTIEAKGNNDCKTTTEVKIMGVKELKVDMDQSEVTQFKCSADQELVAKLKLPITAIEGGSGVYRFTLLKAGAPVAGNIDLIAPEFSIDDEQGGTYTLRVEDAQYDCTAVEVDFPADRAIDPFVKVKKVDSAEAQDITCNAGEKVTVTATLAPQPTKDIRISLSLRSISDGSHQNKTLTVAAGATGVSHTFDDVPMGNYSVVATNEETGCVVYGETYKVQDPNTFSLTATLQKPVKCYGSATGEITFTLADLDLSNSGGVDQATKGFTVKIKGITDPTFEQTVTGPVGQTSVVYATLPYGAYTATATSQSTGCQTKIPANFTIRQADQPIAVTGKLRVPDDCSAEGAGEISVEVVGGVAPYKVTLSGNGGSYTQVAQQVYNRWLFTAVPGANAPGADFDIRVEDAWGCDQTFTQVVKNVIKPDPIDYDDPVIPTVSCKGAEDAYIKIENARGGAYDDPTAAQPKTTYYYELYHSERGAIRPLQTSNEFFNLPAGNYTLVVRDRWNCTKEQQFTIANPPEIKVTKVDGSNLVCYGELGHVKINVVGGTPTGTPSELVYTLDLVDVDSDAVVKTYPDVRASMLPYTINGLTPGVNYRVRATDGKQCPGASDMFALTAAPNLEVRASYEDSCTDNAYEGNVVITFDDATVDYSKMQYSFDGGTSRYPFASGSGQGAQVRINRNHVSVKPSSLPRAIKLYYTEAGTTCEGETNPVIVPVVEKLSLIQDPTTPPGLNELRLLGKNGVPDYVFYFNGVHKGNEGTYIVRIQDPEGVDPSDNKLKKRIEAKVEDSKGCTAEQVFYVDFVDIDIPRFFTPNGDGENDTWSPRNTQQYPNILTQIYDRYGRLLKELSRAETWDGTYNGKALPTGDYWYIITLGEEDDSREFKGHFTLFR